MDGEHHPRAEEVLRLLASAVNALRLYPPSSPLRARAASIFASRSNEVSSALGPLRYVVDPQGFRMGEEVIAPGFAHATQLAQLLHALQVGQLIVVPGVNERETTAFVEASIADPMQVRREGGFRARLVRAGVEHIAVIEVSLRASGEAGLLGLDLMTAPLDEIGDEAVTAAQTWATTAGIGMGQDDMRQVVDGLERAARDVALARVADALMRVDEHTRMKVLAWSLKADSAGERMAGMMRVMAQMKPAALARLLTTVANQTGTDAARIAQALQLPPGMDRLIQLLLAPSPRSEADCGVPDTIDHVALAAEAGTDDDRTDIERQIAIAAPVLAAGKALSAAVAVSKRHADQDTVRAMAFALPRAARDGAFTPTRIALRRLDELAPDPALTESVSAARASLTDPKVLTDVCRAPMNDAEAAIAGEILAAAGPAGAEALVNFYERSDEARRSLMRPVLRSMAEPIIALANKQLRGNDVLALVTVLRILPTLGDQRVVPTLFKGVQDVHTEVRQAAVRGLADTQDPSARQALARILGHWDPETQRLAVREIGRVGAVEAVPLMVRTLEDINIFRLNYELKKEIVRSLAQLGAADSLPTLRRMARRPAFRRRTKELRLLAERAMLSIIQQSESTPQNQRPGSGEPRRQSGPQRAPQLTDVETRAAILSSVPLVDTGDANDRSHDIPHRNPEQESKQPSQQPVGAMSRGVDHGD
jgi:hypothetical protein